MTSFVTHKCNSRAFTLVEMIVASSVLAILMAGLASAIVVATRALPASPDAKDAVVQGALTAETLIDELCETTWIIEHTATAITFAVADRDGDGNAERIRYAWSGNAGDPLTRGINGGEEVSVAEDVRQFSIEYTFTSVAEEYPGPLVESSEAVLDQYVGAANLRNIFIDGDAWAGQYFEPAGIPPDATGWSVNRVLIKAKSKDDIDGETLVQLRLADGGNLPTDTILEEHSMYESDLSGNYTVREFTFDNVSGLAPTDGLCVVLQFASGNDAAAMIQYDRGGGTGLLWTEDAGESWILEAGRSLQYIAYGTWTTPGPPQTATRQYVSRARIILQAGDHADEQAEAGVQTVNTPELLSGLWEPDFESDPTLDHNGDGAADWTVFGGADFNPGALIDGVWHVDTQLYSNPDSDFNTLTTIEARMRATSIGLGPVLELNADWSNGNVAPLYTVIGLESDGTQTLALLNDQGGETSAVLKTVTGLSLGFVQVRLLIDPSLDTVNLRVNGTDCGTFAYVSISAAGQPHCALLYVEDASGEFDSVSIRVGE